MKATYLIVAEYMLQHTNEMLTMAELSKATGLSCSRVDRSIASLKDSKKYKLLIAKNGRNKYGLKQAECREGKRDFVTELFTGNVANAIEISKYIVRSRLC